MAKGAVITAFIRTKHRHPGKMGARGGPIDDNDYATLLRTVDVRFEKNAVARRAALQEAILLRRKEHNQTLTTLCSELVPPDLPLLEFWATIAPTPSPLSAAHTPAVSSLSNPLASAAKSGPLGGRPRFTDEQLFMTQVAWFATNISQSQLPLASTILGHYHSGSIPEDKHVMSEATMRYGVIRLALYTDYRYAKRAEYTFKRNPYAMISLLFDDTEHGNDGRHSLFMRIALYDPEAPDEPPTIFCLFIGFLRVASKDGLTQAQRTWQVLEDWCRVVDGLFVLLLIAYTASTVDHAGTLPYPTLPYPTLPGWPCTS